MRLKTDKERVAVLRIASEIVGAAGTYLRERDFVEILPVLLSPITDPLHHETYAGAVDYYGAPYQLTKSMIFHKQIALRTLPRLFCFSPNVRLEPAERASFGRYLAEFVQLDLEVREASRDEVIELGEGLVVAVLKAVAARCADELALLASGLAHSDVPFERVSYAEAAARFGEPFDDALSATLSAPAWVIDFPRRVREFYDREDPAATGCPPRHGPRLPGGVRRGPLRRRA